MKICVIGAGAVGGLLAVRLALGGIDVSIVEKDEPLQAINNRGLTLFASDGTSTTVKLPCAAHPDDLPRSDLYILAVKANDLAAAACALRSCIGENTLIMPIQNGIPWWYFTKHGGPHDGRRLDSLDPDGSLARCVPADQLIGAIVYPSVARLGPGLIQHVEGNRIAAGEIDDKITSRLRPVLDALQIAGFRVHTASAIRAEVWVKLLGNMSFNPVSALTRSTMSAIAQDEATRDLVLDMMREGATVAQAIGIRLPITPERRLAGAGAAGNHKTSMLQDVEAGRALEIDAILGAVVEIADVVGVAVPRCREVYALTKLLSQSIANEGARLPPKPSMPEI